MGYRKRNSRVLMGRGIFISILLVLHSIITIAQTEFSIHGTVNDSLVSGEQVNGVVIIRELKSMSLIENNAYNLEGLKPGKYILVFEAWNYAKKEVTVQVTDRNIRLDVLVSNPVEELEMVRVTVKRSFDSNKMPDVKGVAIFASKKTEVLIPTPMSTNLAVNIPRQLFKSVPGLNVWESDAGGLQLGIGARGLNPNRTSNFNTRQNGYDISADALGYPESYYTPPSEAIKQIEVIRGAASLQYGPQFGGMLNFVLDDGPDDIKLRLKGSVSVGSFKYYQTYNHVTMNHGKWKFNANFQYKKGNGFRPNSGFDQKTFIAMVSREISKKIKVSAEITSMNYLAQQPGGLMDYQFKQDPSQSLRSRNWFKVKWNLFSVDLDYRITSKLRYNSKVWALNADRYSVGELGKINRPDPMLERDLIRGSYRNVGWENRLLYRYKIKNQRSVLSWGTRSYFGFTFNQQGKASDGIDAEFEYLDPDTPGVSEYRFPGLNHAFYAENLFHLSSRWSITPGVRLEYIRTAAKGYYINQVWSGDELIFSKDYQVYRVRKRSFPLFGIGSSYRIKEHHELYGNASENYRSISFSDLSISNPNLFVDSVLRDETGYNIDLGMRGVFGKNVVRYDIGLFYLQYNNRIGVTEKTLINNGISSLVSYRTNIGMAVTRGLEGYIEWNLLSGLQNVDSFCKNITLFLNGSIMDGKYVSGQKEYVGNRLEFVPEINIKAGLMVCYRNIFLSYQMSYTSEQYSDATNANLVSDATRGIIPSFWIQDVNAGYEFKSLTIKVSVNNLLNSSYFTRRALSYPGPGIIPSEPRTVYSTLIYNLRSRDKK